MLIEIDTASLITAGKMQADCDDLQVTDSDMTTPLQTWIDPGHTHACTANALPSSRSAIALQGIML